MEETKSISLFDLNNQVKLGIKNLFPENYWIVAEISELNQNQSGHCYLELIEKSSEKEQIIARAKATIWAYTYRMLKPYFESVTGKQLSIGIKVMLMISVEFHEVYGYSLNVKDIDPNYTLGDISRKKQEIIQQLQDEGVFDLNKQLNFPIVPQKIAIISSETAAGYGDFMDQLDKNNYGYKFYKKLFPAYMQGSDAEKSIIHALEEIFRSSDFFDIVVIIRGGGSQTDLDCFNSYWLCYHITQFPIPILTGIGHERDETIADLVAYQNLKTPTAVAEYIISKTAEFEMQLNDLSNQALSLIKDRLDELNNKIDDIKQKITGFLKMYLKNESLKIRQLRLLFLKELKNNIKNIKFDFNAIQTRLKSIISNTLHYKKEFVTEFKKNIVRTLKSKIIIEKYKLNELTEKHIILDPENILKRGYTITYRDNSVIKNVETIKKGELIVTRWFNGLAKSTISEIQKKNKK